MICIYSSIYRALYDLLEHLKKQGNYNNQIIIINEAIQTLEKYLIYGEEKDPYILEIFCQYSFIEQLKIFSQNKVKEINLQIIRTLSILIEKITNKLVVYYLMSNNFINNIISNNYFIKYGNNYLLSYVNFLKILSTKLNQTTLPFLFREDINSFPFLEYSLKLYNYPDKIIKDEIKNIFLKVLKIDYQPLSQYICHLPIVSYFCFLACNIKDKIIILSKNIQEMKKNRQYKDNYKILIDDIINSLIFIQNIFDTNCLKINYIIINCMFYYCIIPFIIKSLSLNKNQKKNNNNKNYIIKKSVSLFFLNLLLIYLKNETFLNILFTLIFFPLTTNSINKFIINTPIQPNNYYYDWNLSIKKVSLTFFNYIQFNLNNLFLMSFLYMNNSKYSQIQQIYMKYQKKLNNIHNFDFEKNKEVILKELIKDVLNKLSCSEISIMTSNHHHLSIGTGVNCGLSTKGSTKCVIQKMSKFYLKYFNNNTIKNKLIKNNTKNNLFELMTKKGNENNNYKNILLFNIFLRNILYKNTNISRILLKESNIIPIDLLKDEEISYILNLNKERTLININNKSQYQYDIINKKNNIYNNKSINIYNNSINENSNSKINLKKDININLNKIESKENFSNNLNAQYFETDIFKNSKVSNTLISIDGIVNDSRNTITQKSKRTLKNIDNNGDEDESINLKDKKEEFAIQNKSIEDFLPKNKYSPFDNEYFNNIGKNLNLFCWENNKMTYDHYYNEELVDILINLLDLNNNIEIITCKIIIDNILSLVTTRKDSNYINKNNIINHCFISQNRKNKVNLIYEQYRKEIISNYNNKKSFHNNAYKIFIKQYDKYIILNNFDYEESIKKGYILLCNNLDFLNQNFKNNIFTEIEKSENKYEKNIILYMLIHDFYYKIFFYDNILINQNEQNILENILFINNFPLIKRKGLELNKQYNLIDLDSNIKYYNSKCKIIKDNNNDNNQFFYCYILLYDNFLYIGDSSINSNYTIIKYKFLVSSCSIISDNFNNKNIILNISNGINKENNIEIFLDFKDYNTSKTIISLIEQEIKNSILYEKGIIKQFIEQMY